MPERHGDKPAQLGGLLSSLLGQHHCPCRLHISRKFGDHVRLLSVEVLSRVPWPRGWQWAFARFAGTGAVALGSAVISYGHLHDVLLAWRYPTLAAAVGPLVLDGLMVISGFALLAMSSTSPGDSVARTDGQRSSRRRN